MTIEYNPLKTDYKWMIDQQRMQQVLLNLLMNACKFQKYSKLVVATEIVASERYGANKNNKMLQVTVTDQGIGIDQKDVENLFTPFFKSSSNQSRKHNPKSNGLGLSICKRICQALNGDIWVESTSKEGTVFVFTMEVFQTYLPLEDDLAAIELEPAPVLQ